MKRFSPYIILLLLLAAQVTVLDLLIVRGFKPDLVLIYFLFHFSRIGGFQTVIAGFGIGLLQDLFGGGFIGVNALAKTLAGFLLAKLFPEKVPEEKWLYLGRLFLCIILHDFALWFIEGQAEYQGIGALLFRQVLPSVLYNGFLTFLASIIFIRKRRWA